MADDSSLPIALRRTRRTSRGLPADSHSTGLEVLISSESSTTSRPSARPVPSTPGKRGRPRKQVRFSDPGPSLTHLQDDLPSTGLTPMVCRTTLATSSTKTRRHSTPARSTSSNRSGLSLNFNLDSPSSPFSGDVNLLPLRQVLDGRVKRRIRRNGLSEEMNAAVAEKKARQRERREEVAGLRSQLAEKDEEIRRLREQQQKQQGQNQVDADETIDTSIGDTERIFDLEREVAELRSRLAERGNAPREVGDETSHYDWTLAARDPYAEVYTMLDVGSLAPADDNDDDDDEFSESALAELQCSTPSRRGRARADAGSSFPTPPATSPLATAGTMPLTPTSARFFNDGSSVPTTPQSHHAGVQAALLDPEKQMLEEELASLRLEVGKLAGTLEGYRSLAGRVAERVAGFEPSTLHVVTNDSDDGDALVPSAPRPPEAELEARLTTVLTTLSDRTAALLDLSSSLSGLGFPGADAGEVAASLSAAFRAARLELEYLSPGEAALPLTSAGAAVLDLLLARLRDLSRRAREDEATIDEYHAQELSLRKQLSARVDLADESAAELTALRKEVEERDARIAELQVGLDRLKGAASGYARDAAELERLVERVEAQRVAALDECELARRAGESDLASARAAATAQEFLAEELEVKLSAAMSVAGDLRVRLARAEAEGAAALHAAGEERRAANVEHGRALALRDARVAELRGEVERVNSSLRAAHEQVRALRVDKSGLEERLAGEKAAAKRAVDAIKAELERVVVMGQDFLAAATPRKEKGGGGSAADSKGASGGEREGMPVAVSRPGGIFDANKARRRSGSIGGGGGDAAGGDAGSSAGKGKKRRRYDSGLGFLDEEDVDI